MRHFFLYNLFKHSKPGFVFVAVFILCYAIFFYKKIDTVLFPYNSMFSITFNQKYTASTYGIKINGIPVKITDQFYWKKDFLEESLNNYCKYKKNNDTLFMDKYLHSRINDRTKKDFLLKRLTPDKTALNQWPFWYIGFAGYQIPSGVTIELLQYDFIFENNGAILKDSTSIYKTSF